MLRRLSMIFAVCFAPLLFGVQSRVPGVTVTSNLTDYPQTNLANMVNGVGLPAVTLSGVHDDSTEGNCWATFPGTSTTGTIDFDLHGTYVVDALVYWGHPTSIFAPRGIVLEYSTDGNNFQPVPGAPSELPLAGNFAENVLTFPAVQAAFFRMTITSSWSISPYILINEIAFRTGSQAQVSSNQIVASSTPDSTTINVTSSGPWTASSSSPWVTVTPDSGNGNAVLTVSWLANPSGFARSGSINVDGVNLFVLQAGAAAQISALPGEIRAQRSAGSAEIQVYSLPLDADPAAWIATSDRAWATLSAGSGTGSGTITVNWEENKTPFARSAQIRIGSSIVTVQQPGSLSITQVASYASRVPGAVSPGMLVMIMGNFGSGDRREAPTGSTFFEGVQVFFDSTPAEISFLSQGQVVARVPESTVSGTETSVSVEEWGVRTESVATPVHRFLPGVFTCDEQPLIGRVYSSSDPAWTNCGASALAVRSGMELYFEVTGATPDPDPVTGELPAMTATVQFGDEEFSVYSEASGQMARPGVMKVKFTVPEDAPRGLAIPVRVSVSGVPAKTVLLRIE